MKIVQINQCPNCGGKLEKTGRGNILRCISCDSEFELEDAVKEPEKEPVEESAEEASEEVSKESSGKKKASASSEFKKTDWFDYRIEYNKLLKGKDSKACMKTFVHCTEELGNSEDIIKFIKRDLVEVGGICYKGHKEEKLNNFVNKILKGRIGADETVLFYANSGIFSSGKKGFVITDKKIVFCERKPYTIEYPDLHKIAFDMDSDFVNVRLNGSYDTTMSVIDGGPGKPHGAFAALVSALAFENEPDRDRIIICKYKDDLDDEE